MSTSEALRNVEAFVFDIFGTTVDWHGNIIRTLTAAGGNPEEGKIVHAMYELCSCNHQQWADLRETDWDAFAKEWRKDYFAHA